ncbi:BRO family protein [Campylobacter upsaliensis]|uniref:Helix-turn-helix domain-containing protein n=1 Tax=Campylobacter upsaliensis TaxID=28080 RepID=A0A381F3N9_CAMUP|nr:MULTISPECIES: BRO family protein [Campylobacter]EAI0686972.1 helix-turn-helix domain-containing protein [Campylobacter upsaliensis]EAI3920881.1 helix-turn-helix domain-containing protein [Campylobacter upsaliensis]EAI6696524.1 helix-turn-helix domain-containing protein [Campylobacter upsaliensis]EAI7279017.1 helix-turn-helix domain-containing protein [Campylobacter upsaliensis]EAI8233486.1 helix-turn-helix domain-containing protein [Campylobacter upsaliensis]
MEDNSTKNQSLANNNNFQIFQREEKKLRIIKNESGEPLFCLKDICDSLEIQNNADIKNAILKEFEAPRLNLAPFQTQGEIQHFTMITEPQLYFMLMRSDKPKAREFRQWVINEVLPSIRKNRAYRLEFGLNDKAFRLEKELDKMKKVSKLKDELIEAKNNLIKTQEKLIKTAKKNKFLKKEYSKEKEENQAWNRTQAALAVGARLASVRKAENLKQIQMAKMLNTEARTYSYIEKDGKSPLRPEMMIILFKEFKVDLQWLITGEAIPTSKEVLNTMRVAFK